MNRAQGIVLELATDNDYVDKIYISTFEMTLGYYLNIYIH